MIDSSRFYDEAQLRALKEGVRYVFWKKDEFRRLFDRCQVPGTALAGVLWEGNSWNIVDHVLEILNKHAAGIGSLRAIANETLHYKNGDHLRWAGDDRVVAAEHSLRILKQAIGEHSDDLRRKQDAKIIADRTKHIQNDGALFRSKLAKLNSEYMQWFGQSDPIKRGFAFEKILSGLFDLNDLAPAGSFRRLGEQIDGAFKLDSENYLLEAKWQQNPVNLADLRDLDGAVSSTLETTLGLFVSVHGFSPNGISGYLQGNRPRIFCVDGGDLAMIFETRIGLPQLLRRKKELASQRREINVSAQDILAGKY